MSSKELPPKISTPGAYDHEMEKLKNQKIFSPEADPNKGAFYEEFFERYQDETSMFLLRTVEQISKDSKNNTEGKDAYKRLFSQLSLDELRQLPPLPNKLATTAAASAKKTLQARARKLSSFLRTCSVQELKMLLINPEGTEKTTNLLVRKSIPTMVYTDLNRDLIQEILDASSRVWPALGIDSNAKIFLESEVRDLLCLRPFLKAREDNVLNLELQLAAERSFFRFLSTGPDFHDPRMQHSFMNSLLAFVRPVTGIAIFRYLISKPNDGYVKEFTEYLLRNFSSSPPERGLEWQNAFCALFGGGTPLSFAERFQLLKVLANNAWWQRELTEYQEQLFRFQSTEPQKKEIEHEGLRSLFLRISQMSDNSYFLSKVAEEFLHNEVRTDIHEGPFELSRGLFAQQIYPPHSTSGPYWYILPKEFECIVREKTSEALRLLEEGRKEPSGDRISHYTSDDEPIYESNEKIKSAHRIFGDIDALFQEHGTELLALVQNFLPVGTGNALTMYAYEEMISSHLRSIIEHDFAIELKDLSILEQFYFLNYAKDVTLGGVFPVQQFTKTFGVAGLKTFLALGQDPKAAEWILTIGRELEEPLARQVFEKYAEISASIQQVQQYVTEHFQFKHREAPQGLTEDIVQNLLLRGKNLLRDMAQETTHNSEVILQKLSDIKTETSLLTAATRALVERQELNLEELKGVSFELHQGGSLDGKDKEELARVWEGHYEGKYPSELEGDLREQFQTALESPTSHFYLLRFEGTLVSFMRTDERPERQGQNLTHLASFFTDQKYAGGKLGQALFAKVVAERSQGSILVAECDPDTPLSQWYLSLGFKVVDEKPEQGVPTWHIELTPPRKG